MIGRYCIVRTHSAGVFAGTPVERAGKEVRLIDTRRIWYWAGAASLSQLAQSGASRPSECKFPEAVGEMLLLEVIEITPITDVARLSLERVAVWQK